MTIFSKWGVSAGNHENISFAFFPTNHASLLYVSVEYTIWYSDNTVVGSGDTLNISFYTEVWVWSNTVVYILFHPRYLSINYVSVDDSVQLTISTLCHYTEAYKASTLMVRHNNIILNSI